MKDYLTGIVLGGKTVFVLFLGGHFLVLKSVGAHTASAKMYLYNYHNKVCFY